MGVHILNKSKLTKQTFLQGALVVAVANIVVKIIGALFKIPLTRLILKADGIGIYNSSYTIYNALFVISTAGLPVAISKVISEANASGNYAELKKTYKVAQRLLLIIGLVSSLTLLVGAQMFANYIKAPRAALAILAMAPSLFFVSLLSSYRGFFQGMGNMIPTAISEFIEASGKLFVGLALAYFLIPFGEEYSAAGAILGVSTGTFIAACFMMVYHKKALKEIDFKIKETGVKPVNSTKKLYSRLIRLAVPITLGASVFTLASVIDLTMIMRQLARLGFGEVERSRMYGYYSGYAVTMFNLPPTVITSLSISIVPVIAAAIVKNNILEARRSTETALRITFLFSLPCAVGMSVLSEPILNLIYDDINAAPLLAVLAYGIIFVSLVMVSNAVIQAYGKPWIPVFNMLIGGLVKVVTNYVLVGNIDININGAPYGTVLCYFVTASLDLIVIRKYLNPNYGLDFVIKTVFSAAIMGISVYFTYSKLFSFGYVIALLAGIFVGVVVYFILLLVTKAIKKQDVSAMPGAEKLMKLMKNFVS